MIDFLKKKLKNVKIINDSYVDNILIYNTFYLVEIALSSKNIRIFHQ